MPIHPVYLRGGSDGGHDLSKFGVHCPPLQTKGIKFKVLCIKKSTVPFSDSLTCKSDLNSNHSRLTSATLYYSSYLYFLYKVLLVYLCKQSVLRNAHTHIQSLTTDVAKQGAVVLHVIIVQSLASCSHCHLHVASVPLTSVR